jgi:hypothetical protein
VGPAGRAFPWLDKYLTPDALREMLPELASYRIDRFRLPNLLAVNFVVHGFLGQGVASSTRFDPQAKSLGEVLRACPVSIPRELADLINASQTS